MTAFMKSRQNSRETRREAGKAARLAKTLAQQLLEDAQQLLKDTERHRDMAHHLAFLRGRLSSKLFLSFAQTDCYFGGEFMSLVYGSAKKMAEENTVTETSCSYDQQVVGAAQYILEVYGPECAAKWKYETHWSSGTTLWKNQLNQAIMLKPQPNGRFKIEL